MARLKRSDLGRVAARSALLQATWNYERQQGLGWAWSLEPALSRLYPDRRTRCQRLAEHTGYFNTQPTLASVALGAVAGLEELRSEEGVDGDGVARVKAALGSALAALGDRLFWFTLRPFAACLGVILALGGSRTGALVMWLCYNVVHLWIRWRGVAWGYRRGPGVLGEGLRESLEKLVRRLGTLGSVLVGILMAMLLVPGGAPRSVPFQMLMVAGLLVGLLTAPRARPTPSQWALGLGALAAVVAWLR
jgi:PTS system mannose-specific IID component